ncbi:hypothetical protein RRG08_030494 [Elysia crispata]|uniref:Uncharacterized protein n=1 Tax=Elysia crispata TaxID=231223 RepID=A0AAE0Y7X6_9GAST|nr:hypothetical protein RRG08_030494 [Elysia crispata]
MWTYRILTVLCKNVPAQDLHYFDTKSSTTIPDDGLTYLTDTEPRPTESSTTIPDDGLIYLTDTEPRPTESSTTIPDDGLTYLTDTEPVPQNPAQQFLMMVSHI